MLSSHKMTLAILPSDRTERYLLPILLIMFVFGVALACIEVVNWWKARLAQFRPPPLAKLITYDREADGRWHATQVLCFRLRHVRGIPERLQPSVQNVEEDQQKKAA